MNYYKIVTRTTKGKVIISPFKFSKKKAEELVKIANKNFSIRISPTKKTKHTVLLAKDSDDLITYYDEYEDMQPERMREFLDERKITDE